MIALGPATTLQRLKSSLDTLVMLVAPITRFQVGADGQGFCLYNEDMISTHCYCYSGPSFKLPTRFALAYDPMFYHC